MICPNCNTGYMLQHQEEQYFEWVKCDICRYTCKGKELVSYYKSEKTKRTLPRKQIAESEALSLGGASGLLQGEVGTNRSKS